MAGLTIGAVAKATGIPVQTLRTWERRYGFPSPERTDTGHRRYRVDTVPRLKLIERAIELGHRASTVVSADMETLSALVELVDEPVVAPSAPSVVVPEPEVSRPREPAAAPVTAPVEPAPRPPRRRARPELLAAVEALDSERLWCVLESALVELGLADFVAHCLEPMLDAISAGWRMGTLDVVHERLATELVSDFLAARWRAIVRALPSSAPGVVLATLVGEPQVVSLQLAALGLASAGVRVQWLGAEMPLTELERAVRRLQPRAVAVSMSSSVDLDTARAQVARLRERLERDVALLVGGRGAPTGIAGVVLLHGIDDARAWAGSVLGFSGF